MMTASPNSGSVDLNFEIGFSTDTLLLYTQGDVTRLGEIGGIIKSLYRLRRHVAAGESLHLHVYVKTSIFKAVLPKYYVAYLTRVSHSTQTAYPTLGHSK